MERESEMEKERSTSMTQHQVPDMTPSNSFCEQDRHMLDRTQTLSPHQEVSINLGQASSPYPQPDITPNIDQLRSPYCGPDTTPHHHTGFGQLLEQTPNQSYETQLQSYPSISSGRNYNGQDSDREMGHQSRPHLPVNSQHHFVDQWLSQVAKGNNGRFQIFIFSRFH